MGLARSTYYFEISKTDVVAERNKDLIGEIGDIFDHHKGRYGVRRVHAELVNRGKEVLYLFLTAYAGIELAFNSSCRQIGTKGIEHGRLRFRLLLGGGGSAGFSR